MNSKRSTSGALTRFLTGSLGAKPDGTAGASSEPTSRRPATAKPPMKEEAELAPPVEPSLGTQEESDTSMAAEVARLQEEVKELNRRLTTFQLVVAQQMEDSDVRLETITSQMKEFATRKSSPEAPKKEKSSKA